MRSTPGVIIIINSLLLLSGISFLVSTLKRYFTACICKMASVSSRLLLLLGLSSLLCPLASSYEVIYAVNCGGGRHTDLNGIKYRKDDIDDGVASDFGKGLTIARVPPEDQILYQTERYHYRDFSYDVPVRSDGNYFVVLKFAEVYFQRPNEKVFGGRG